MRVGSGSSGGESRGERATLAAPRPRRSRGGDGIGGAGRLPLASARKGQPDTRRARGARKLVDRTVAGRRTLEACTVKLPARSMA
eukprot:6768916-Prymnesium_polylepis.1